MNASSNLDSPFHRGEQQIQAQLGVREQMEQFGKQVILDYLPAQHRDFYQQLPFVLVGHADKQGNPWASILFKQHQLMHSPNPENLHINALPVAGDPLQDSLSTGLRLGLLGIELSSRRRNRVSAHIESFAQQGLQLKVDQAFGNCPQYIQPRQWHWLNQEPNQQALVKKITRLDQAANDLITNSDTFFVASSLAKDGNHPSDGADVSHRGGEEGFVRVDSATSLTIPDYSGNMHFNTLGNFIENPKAGMLFVDFEKGRLLTLTGSVEVIWESDDIANFAGAERLWRFNLEHGFWLENSLPIRWHKSGTPHPSRPIMKKEASNTLATKELDKTREPAEQALVDFAGSSVQKLWLANKDGTLLEFAEAQGLKPKFGCRKGNCGACRVELISGSVSYVKEVTALIDEDEILICCAVPAKSDNEEVAELSVKL